ncbi:fibrinogen-like protein 1 [Scaptodrosophila lebanonensis]|uniref:Fibrinogen-like protein 1 n=1 Tax=Drosophila lebanonensis TaxID=7225 RepID=A0A6J2UB08_DROLE|nr:fibrinogen-like protein 1 [Scaptodrosophila lebanonensis]
MQYFLKLSFIIVIYGAIVTLCQSSCIQRNKIRSLRQIESHHENTTTNISDCREYESRLPNQAFLNNLYKSETLKDTIEAKELEISKLNATISKLEFERLQSINGCKECNELVVQIQMQKEKIGQLQLEVEMLKFELLNWKTKLSFNVNKEDTFFVPNDKRVVGAHWTTIQHRIDGTVDFRQDWKSYRDGFGILDADFFLGLENIHQWTISQPHELLILLKDWNNIQRHAHYDHFSIGSELQKYKLLTLGNYSGNAGDALTPNLYANFSTYDRDNDNLSALRCDEWRSSGWWYHTCVSDSNLNGHYCASPYCSKHLGRGIVWNTAWHNWQYSLKSVQMLIRQINH